MIQNVSRERIILSVGVQANSVIRDADGIPTALRLLDRGVNRSTKGDLIFNTSSAEKISKEAADWGNQYFFDYDHAIFDKDNTAPDKGKAAGWYDLEVRDDGLWAVNIEWTPPALEYLKNKEFKYFSPAFWYDTKTLEFDGYINTALTNYPARKNLEPLVLSGLDIHNQTQDLRVGAHSITLDQLCTALRQQLERNFPDMWVVEVYNDHVIFWYSRRYFRADYTLQNDTPQLIGDAVEVTKTYIPTSGGTTMKILLSALGLAETADEATALKTFNGIRGNVDSVLTLTGKANFGEALGVIQAWKQGAEQTASLTAQLAEITAKQTAERHTALLSKGLEAGQITPATKEFWAKQPVDVLAGFLESAAAVVQLGQEFQAPPAAGKGTATWNGKAFKDLSYAEQHNLYVENPELYKTMEAAQ